MRVLHICLANFYIDNHSYQENMITKYHKLLGLEVEIIASLVSFDTDGKPCELEKIQLIITNMELKLQD